MVGQTIRGIVGMIGFLIIKIIIVDIIMLPILNTMMEISKSEPSSAMIMMLDFMLWVSPAVTILFLFLIGLLCVQGFLQFVFNTDKKFGDMFKKEEVE